MNCGRARSTGEGGGAIVTTRLKTPDGTVGLSVTMDRHGCASKIAITLHGTTRPRHAEDAVAWVRLLLAQGWIAKGIAALAAKFMPADSISRLVAEAVAQAEDDAKRVGATKNPETDESALAPLTWAGKKPDGKEGV